MADEKMIVAVPGGARGTVSAVVARRGHAGNARPTNRAVAIGRIRVEIPTVGVGLVAVPRNAAPNRAAAMARAVAAGAPGAVTIGGKRVVVDALEERAIGKTAAATDQRDVREGKAAAVIDRTVSIGSAVMDGATNEDSGTIADPVTELGQVVTIAGGVDSTGVLAREAFGVRTTADPQPMIGAASVGTIAGHPGGIRTVGMIVAAASSDVMSGAVARAEVTGSNSGTSVAAIAPVRDVLIDVMIAATTGPVEEGSDAVTTAATIVPAVPASDVVMSGAKMPVVRDVSSVAMTARVVAPPVPIGTHGGTNAATIVAGRVRLAGRGVSRVTTAGADVMTGIGHRGRRRAKYHRDWNVIRTNPPYPRSI